MDKPQLRDDVAVFVDFENVYVSVREKFDATPNFELIMDRCEDYGRIIIARAYADWYRYPRVTSALFANGVEPMYVPTYYYDRDVGRTGRPIKNSVDIHLCIDVMRTLYSQTHIEKFVLVTGDRDFIPLVNAIRQHGKEVIVIGIGGAASAHLAQSADEFLFYEQIADLKQDQRQAEQQRASEQRDKSETRDKSDKRERKDDARTPVEPAEQPASPKTVYDTLVDAIQLARQRGFVSNLGSLKVIMRELDSTFNETKLKDASGKSFTKFKEFVEEGQRLGKVQIFTNGTVTEIFLPGEDPYQVSQFAEEFAARTEDDAEAPLDLVESNGQVPVPALFDELPVEAAPTTTDESAIVLAAAEAAPLADVPGQMIEPTPPAALRSFDDQEWYVLLNTMAQLSGPVRFNDIFEALRNARNQELVELTNTELRDMIKQAINQGLLQRTGRASKAYYRLSAQGRSALDVQQAAQDASVPDPQPEPQQAEVDQEDVLDTAQQRVADQRKPRRRRRSPARDTTPTLPERTPFGDAPGTDEDVPADAMLETSLQVSTELEDDLERLAEPGNDEPGIPAQPMEDLAAEPDDLVTPADQPAPELQQAMEAFLDEAAPDTDETAQPDALPLYSQADALPLYSQVEANSESLQEESVGEPTLAQDLVVDPAPAVEDAEAMPDSEAPARRPRRRRRKPTEQNGETASEDSAAALQPEMEMARTDSAQPETSESSASDEPAPEDAPKRRRTRRKKTEE